MIYISGGGCIGCPKQSIDQLKTTFEFYTCQFQKWKAIESELFRLYDFDEIDNPYMFTRHDETTGEFTLGMTSSDLEKYFKSKQRFDFHVNLKQKEISCLCG